MKKGAEAPFWFGAEPKYRLFGPHPDGAIQADHFAVQIRIFGNVPDQPGEFGRFAHA